jgi:hypothetical protein
MMIFNKATTIHSLYYKRFGISEVTGLIIRGKERNQQVSLISTNILCAGKASTATLFFCPIYMGI